MTIDDIATANKMSLEEFFQVCWKWKNKTYKFPPKATIREDIRTMYAHNAVPRYVADYIGQFTLTKGEGHA